MNVAGMRVLWIALLITGTVGCARAAPEAGTVVSAPRPERIVTLAPHLAELVFAAGAGSRLVGVSAYSDYPDPVRNLPVVGDAFIVDQEQLAMLRPDLILTWQSGTPSHVVDELRQLDYRVEVVRTRGIADVSKALLRIGELTGSTAPAASAARKFTDGMAELAERWSDAAPIRTFYQISARPLYTVNGDHYISELIRLCGGKNVFGELRDLAPLVSEEAVLERNPEVLLAAGVAGERLFRNWSRWPGLAANRYGNHFLIPADETGRATPRLLQAGHSVCNALQQARERRSMARAGTGELRCIRAGCDPR